jgi:hypothetical protein
MVVRYDFNDQTTDGGSSAPITMTVMALAVFAATVVTAQAEYQGGSDATERRSVLQVFLVV